MYEAMPSFAVQDHSSDSSDNEQPPRPLPASRDPNNLSSGHRTGSNQSAPTYGTLAVPGSEKTRSSLQTPIARLEDKGLDGEEHTDRASSYYDANGGGRAFVWAVKAFVVLACMGIAGAMIGYTIGRVHDSMFPMV